MKRNIAAVALLTLLLSALSGCRNFGPKSIVTDRLDYNHAIATSWKEQTLLNIVKLRYADTPFFVDIPQITSGYTLQRTAGMNGGIFPPVNPELSFAQQLGLGLNVQGSYQDRPTISYAPQTGSQFVRNLTSPINPGSLLYLLQSGYPADVIFKLTVDSINGLRNQSILGAQLREADPEFLQVVDTLRKAQLQSHIGIRVHHEADKSDAVAIFFPDKQIAPELESELRETRSLLGLSPDDNEFRVVSGNSSTSPKEIAITSRSALRLLTELSGYVEVPPEHQLKEIATPITIVPSEDQPMRIHSGKEKPCDAYAEVCYEGYWFWIPNNDFQSKRTVTYLLLLLAIADTGSKENMPVITIQAN